MELKRCMFGLDKAIELQLEQAERPTILAGAIFHSKNDPVRFSSYKDAKEFAERICQCVNGWDDLVKQRDALLEASEKLIKSLGNCSGSFNYNPKIEDDVRTAIANCRK